MPLVVKGLTLGGGEGVKYVPWVCSYCEGGGLTRGNTDLLFIHCMNRGSAFPPLTGPGAVPGVCPAAIEPAGHTHGSRGRAGGACTPPAARTRP